MRERSWPRRLGLGEDGEKSLKTLLFLGAAHFQVPPLLYARSKGYRIITTDNIPANPGHALADRAYSVSTLDREKILEIAEKENVDGVLSFASDVGTRTAAFVAEELGLPGNPLPAVELLANKGKFRQLLENDGIQKQRFGVFDLGRENTDPVFSWLSTLQTILIKPVDSSGSKGVSVIQPHEPREIILEKIKRAREHSISKQVILETFIKGQGRQICGDGFFQDGKIVFIQFGDGLFHDKSEFLAPYGELFPSARSQAVLSAVHEKLQRILIAAGFKQGPINIDVLITESGEPFVIEIAPRSGGNFIPRAIAMSTGVDLVASAVETALDSRYRLEVPTRIESHPHACFMLHSLKEGVYGGYRLSQEWQARVVEHGIARPVGSVVHPFVSGSEAIGHLIFKFRDVSEMGREMSKAFDQIQLELT